MAYCWYIFYSWNLVCLAWILSGFVTIFKVLLDFILLFSNILVTKIYLILFCLFSLAGFCINMDVALLNTFRKFPIVNSYVFHYIFCILSPSCFLFLAPFFWQHTHCLTTGAAVTSNCAFAALFSIPVLWVTNSYFPLLVGFFFLWVQNFRYRRLGPSFMRHFHLWIMH